MTTRIVGLDLSLTSTGVVVLESVDGIAWPAQAFRSIGEAGSRTDTYVQRSRRIRTQCRAIMEQIDFAQCDDHVGLAVIEGPLYGVKTMPSYFDRAGLFHGVFAALDARGIPVAVIPPTTGHQFVTGKGHAEKKHILAEVKRWWPATYVANDDVADAAGLALMGAMHSGWRPPFRPAARHYHAIATAQWPAGGRT
jgi:Holliday junction resolvasome RuvABC endonuclease subunit